jgi:[ribosomal protein S18]-alanine N-acetyltransferase
VEIEPLTAAHADAISTWRYPGRYSTYDVGEIVTHADGYWAVVDQGELVGYCCLGVEARVPGVDEEGGTLDVGYGMRPDLVGKGLGRLFVAAIVDWAVDEFSPQRVRMLILRWNERSRKVAEAIGSTNQGSAWSGGREFVIMALKASPSQRSDPSAPPRP